jgi:PAS domain S-box-containing protein
VSKRIGASVADEGVNREERALAALHDLVGDLLEVREGAEVCRIVAEAVHRLLPDAVVIVNHITEDGRALRTGEIVGLGDRLEGVIRLIGRDPRDIEWPLDALSASQQALLDQSTLDRLEGGLRDAALGRLPDRVCRAIEKLFGIEAVYGIGCSWHGRIMGTLLVFARAGCEVEPWRGTVQAIVRQAAFAMQRAVAERALMASRSELRATIDGIDDALHVVDPELRVRVTNAAFDEWRRRLGCDDEAVGRPLEEVCPFVDVEDLAAYRAVLASGERHERLQEMEVGGRALIAETRLVPVRHDGAVTGVITMVRDVTRRVQAEDALRQSSELLLEEQRRLEEAQRLARIGDWRWDVASGETHWSDEVFVIFGLEPGERDPSYELARDLVHPDDRERWAQAVAKALESRETFQLEYRAVRADGAMIWVRNEGVVERDAHGRATAITGTAQDITARRLQEERLEREYRREHALDEFVTELIGLVDVEEVCRHVGAAAHALLPRAMAVTSAPQPDGTTFRMVDALGFDPFADRILKLLPVDPFTIRFNVADLTSDELAQYRSGRLHRAEAGIYTATMRRIPRPICRAVEKLLRIRAVYTIGFAWEGHSYGGVALLLPEGVSLDEHVETIERMVHQASIAMERALALSALRESEERYRTIFQDSVVGIWRTSPDGRYLAANPAVARVYGFDSPEQMLSEVEDVSTDVYADPEDRRAFLELIEREGQVRDYVLQNRRRDGSLVWLKESAQVTRDADGRTLYYEGTVEDISAEWAAREEARASAEQTLVAESEARASAEQARAAEEEARMSADEARRAQTEAQAAAERLREALEGTVKAMGALTEVRDPYTAGHERRVTMLAVAIAQRLGMDHDSLTALRLAGQVHDIGKISVPAEILNKPGALTEMEFELVKQHPRLAYAILNTVSFEWPVALIVLQHHERVDGSGYPHGITGDEILPEARVLAVADVVESMASHRPYRPALGMDAALAEVEAGRGTLYDAAAVDACLATVGEEGFELPD